MGAAGARGEEGLGDERSPSIDNTRTNVAGLVEQRTDGADNGSRKPNGRFEIAMNKHNFRSFILGFSLVSCLSASPAVAATVDTTGLTTCSLSGWSSDPDPAGLNIRSAPRADAEIIGRVSAARAQGRDSYAAEFDIIGSRNGWFLVRGVKFADYGSGKGDSVVFAGPGWVFADKVRFMINRAEVRGRRLTTDRSWPGFAAPMAPAAPIARSSIMYSAAPAPSLKPRCIWRASARCGAGSPASAAIR